MRVGVLGAGGRMGAMVCRAVESDSRFVLAGAIDPAQAGAPLSGLMPEIESDLLIGGSLEQLIEAGVEAIVDFTVASAASENLTFCAEHGIHAVCGTTGMHDDVLERLTSLFDTPAAPNCVIAPNFAISAVLLMRFCELAAPFFEGVEIIELHHNEKRDAPSGTALETARRIAAARAGEFAPDPTTDEVRTGARGATEQAIHIHSIRLPGLIAHQEVLFGAAGQSLRIHQDSFDRSSFMPGVLFALSKVASTPGLTVGLDALLDV